MGTAAELEFPVAGTSARVSGLLLRPPEARFLYVMAHGAGAGMRHPFLETLASLLAQESIATFRYQFPYEEGRRRPDPPHLLEATVRSAVATARAERLPMVAGGKSMGGRMTSGAAAKDHLPGARDSFARPDLLEPFYASASVLRPPFTWSRVAITHFFLIGAEALRSHAGAGDGRARRDDRGLGRRGSQSVRPLSCRQSS